MSLAAPLVINLRAVDCPQCGKQMPFWRKPTDFRQMLYGGWACSRCGCRMDRFGKAIEPIVPLSGGSSK